MDGMSSMAPELINAVGEESRGGSCFAFGEQPSIYGEVYFLSEEVLGKKGAVVELAFEQEFARVPVAPRRREPRSDGSWSCPRMR